MKAGGINSSGRHVTIVAVEEEEDDEVGIENISRKNVSTSDFDRSVSNKYFLNMPANEFAEGCKLLQAAALGNITTMETILYKRPKFVDFRDYDRRTALHVAASEGHLEICKWLVQRGARINRSDGWGGSPLVSMSVLQFFLPFFSRLLILMQTVVDNLGRCLEAST